MNTDPIVLFEGYDDGTVVQVATDEQLRAVAAPFYRSSLFRQLSDAAWAAVEAERERRETEAA